MTGILKGNGLFLADLNAALATKAFFCIYGNGFTILHLKHIHGADFHTFLAAFAFLFVNAKIETHLKGTLS